ncbi:polysaccharide pyruvyl transferase family protein [Microbacterium sp. 179-B 1A2 NHS]|uniref:polysaccharide pyruvyl transferase family protein n=1 Tax=Microbacterium sp. 179-B 1A2 NHS TaxID=3142383 RepID=UPI0039A038E9
MSDGKIRILVLTNRDSDNVGDQIIEATVISLLKAAMGNLDIPDEGFDITSRAASLISRKYMRTGDPALLTNARKAISESDVVVFGGAPLFNYRYQSFYLRTIKTLELAREYGVPVLFSSIGVEPFDAANPKSVQLRDALISSGVRQITTRDDVESARRYVQGTDINVAHVSDPAVFADVIFGPSRLKQKPATGSAPRVGLVVTRAGIFKDNGIPFTESDQRRFWLGVIDTLTARGYDYKLFTTGHFSDEVFLDALVRAENIPLSKAAITVNSPEELIDELAACDGIIAYRLHASITSFAYGIPSIGLSWNFKVPYFYDSVGHGDRALDHSQWRPETVVSALEKAMAEGVTKDEQFLLSVYDTLFSALKGIFAPESARSAYTYEELRKNLPRYGGTSLRQYREKIRRKLRRTYEYYKPPTAADKTLPEPVSAGFLARVKRRIKAAF